MSEPNWARILKVFYEEDEWIPYPRSDEKPLAEIGLKGGSPLLDVDMTEDEIEDTVSYLRKVGLIEQDDRDEELPEKHDSDYRTVYGLSLTKRGFDVAHERELNHQRTQTNRALVGFTIALVLVGVFGNYPNIAIQRYGNIAILVLLIGLIIWTDFFGLRRT